MNKHTFSIDDNEPYYTATEQLIICQLVKGLSNKQICDKFMCSEKTVKGHVTSILKKSGTHSRSAFIAQFYERQVQALQHKIDTISKQEAVRPVQTVDNSGLPIGKFNVNLQNKTESKNHETR